MLKRYIILLAVFGVIFVPFFAFSAGLVPCGDQRDPTTGEITNMCTLCDLYILAQNIMKFLMWTIAPVIATFAIAWGGFNILISGASPSSRNKGIDTIKKTVIGLLILFSSWIVINELLLFFSGGTETGTILQSPWNKVECVSAVPPTEPGVAGVFNNITSPELAALITLVQSSVPGVVIVSPQTDSHIASGFCNPTNPSETFNSSTRCQHIQFSCHYGGTSCINRGSFAFDFVAASATDPVYLAVAAVVPPGAFMQFEPLSAPHGHVSIGNIYGCSCS